MQLGPILPRTLQDSDRADIRSWYFGGAAMLLPVGRGMVVFTDENALGGEGCA